MIDLDPFHWTNWQLRSLTILHVLGLIFQTLMGCREKLRLEANAACRGLGNVCQEICHLPLPLLVPPADQPASPLPHDALVSQEIGTT